MGLNIGFNPEKVVSDKYDFYKQGFKIVVENLQNQQNLVLDILKNDISKARLAGYNYLKYEIVFKKINSFCYEYKWSTWEEKIKLGLNKNYYEERLKDAIILIKYNGYKVEYYPLKKKKLKFFKRIDVVVGFHLEISWE
jgi:hypothetical protein